MINLLSETFPLSSAVKAAKSTTINSGPFAGLTVPHASAHANAAYILRELIHTFLITHPHLDHMSGFIINTPAFQPSARAKRCAGLPNTIEAIRTHIFNDVIWPNLSDEDGGVGLVTYMRLTEGGNDFLGHGDGRGYIELAEGLGAKGWSVTHGTCHKIPGFSTSHSHHRQTSMGFPAPIPDGQYTRRHSRVSEHEDNSYTFSSSQPHHRRTSITNRLTTPSTPTHHTPSIYSSHEKDPYDSSAFFIRDDTTCNEILIWGDVEPDSISLHPRNHYVWRDAAPKVASGSLPAIFIECSYDDKAQDHFLFGHLCPRHLIAELETLATEVQRHKQRTHLASLPQPELLDPPSPQSQRSAKRARIDSPNTNGSAPYVAGTASHNTSPKAPPIYSRRKTPNPGTPLLRASNSAHGQRSIPSSPRTPTGNGHGHNPSHDGAHVEPPPLLDQSLDGSHLDPETSPLQGVTVYVIHVKDTYEDGPPIGDQILSQLEEQSKEKGLGCSFVITEQGGSYFI